MRTLNIEYIIAHFYFWFINIWPSREAWLSFQIYLGLVWAILGFIGSILLVYMVIMVNKTQAAHRKELLSLLINNWEKKLNDKTPEEWQEILEALDSENVNDWKLAIIKADTLLDGLTVRMNVVGENLGERLKNIAKGDLNNLDEAWEAHKVRNQIAHDNDFVLSKYETRRVISLYERVFRELGYI